MITTSSRIIIVIIKSICLIRTIFCCWGNFVCMHVVCERDGNDIKKNKNDSVTKWVFQFRQTNCFSFLFTLPLSTKCLMRSLSSLSYRFIVSICFYCSSWVNIFQAYGVAPILSLSCSLFFFFSPPLYLSLNFARTFFVSPCKWPKRDLACSADSEKTPNLKRLIKKCVLINKPMEYASIYAVSAEKRWPIVEMFFFSRIHISCDHRMW